MKISQTILALAIAALGTTATFAASTFTATGVIDMLPTSMSDDASIVVGVGTFGEPNLYYTEADGASVIGDGCPSGRPAISGDGTVILGCHVDAAGKWNAAQWLGGMSWLDLGSEAGAVPCDLFLSGSYGVDQDGSLGVGLLWRAQVCHANAGTWDLDNGGPAIPLPSLIEGPASRANAVNADGSVIVGWQDQESGERVAAKWVNGAPDYILTPAGGFNGEAEAVSADGNTIVGGGYDFGADAWIWNASQGTRAITLEGNPGNLIATDVSDDGRTVIGNSTTTGHGFVWREGRKVRNLQTSLKRNGAVIPNGWHIVSASVLSADGNIIYGFGVNPDGLIEMYKAVLNDGRN